MHTNTTGLVLRAVPAAIGIGLTWLGITLIKNERELLFRRLELESALKEKSNAERRKLLLGN